MSFTIILAIIIYLVSAGIIVAVAITFVRMYLHRITRTPTAFQMVPLLVTLPKESTAKEEQEKEIKDQIAIAQSLYAALGGMKAQKGWHHFWFGRTDHISFEIVAGGPEHLISFYVVAPRYLKEYVEQQVHAQYDEADIEEVEDYNIFNPTSTVVGAYLVQKRSYIFPIQTYDKLETDPLNSITNSLSKLHPSEGAAIQFLIRSARPEWHKLPAKVAQTMQQGKKLDEALNEVNGNPLWKMAKFMGSTFFKRSKREEYEELQMDPDKQRGLPLSPAEGEVIKALEEKTSLAGFNVNIRIIVSSVNEQAATARLGNILNAFSQYAGYEYGNAFKAKVTGTKEKPIHDFIYRHFDDQKTFILNTKEMASLFHMPLPTTDTPNIRWLMAKKAPPPSNMPQDGIQLGEVVYRGVKTPVRMKREDRRRHVYMVGRSGVGKSVLLQNMAIQDITNGEGVCIIDPHGELIEDILPHIPKERADDVVIFDPSDVDRPVGLNMLEYTTPQEKDFAVQELIAIFYKLFGEEMIGPMFEHYMRNAMLALMEDKESGATIVEIPRMFTDQKFRKQKLAKVKNPVVKNFWEQEYEQSQKGSQAADMLSYVISKIGRFLSNDMMRNIVGQTSSGFDFHNIMNDQKIFLVNLSKGKVGEVNSALLGLILVSKIQMAALSRASLAKEKRKYLLNLTLAHQYIGQLINKGDAKIRDAVFGNAGTIVAFRVGVEDAEMLAKEFAPVFNENDVINVDKFTANVKLLIDNTASRPFNMKTIMPTSGDPTITAKLKQLSRLKYGRDRQIVESEVLERSQLGNLRGNTAKDAPDTLM